MKILFVCTGNLCRSPMAEALMRHELALRGCDGIEVASAGTWAAPGSGATTYAIDVLAERQIPLERHRSRSLTAAEATAADLVVAMTSVHRSEIEQIAPGTRTKTVLLKEIAEIGWSGEPPDAEARLDLFLVGERPPPRRALDVDDPMGLPPSAYDRCAGEIELGVRALADILCGRGDRLPS